MKSGRLRIATCALTASIAISNMYIPVSAGRVTALPSAGIDYTLGGNTSSLKDMQEESKDSSSDTTQGASNNASPSPSATASPDVTASPSASPEADSQASADAQDGEGKIIEETVTATSEKPLKEKEKELSAKREEEGFKNLVIADVNDYVNIRSIPSEEGEILGKLYDESVGTFVSESDGWYEITSGTVTGYVKAEYCVTGEEAVALAKEVGTRIATVSTTTLKVREEPGTDAVVLGLVPDADELLVTEEMGDWIKVNIEEGDGYVSADYVTLSTEFVQAESKEEEEARLAKEKADRLAAQEAAAKSRQSSSSQNAEVPTVYVSGGGSALGNDVANYACQFVGNPYVYGGSSLTNGTDCSGFVMSVYANFGVSLPHSSSADRNVGSAVDGIANAQPGDIICYSGHVGIYIGNGQIVHASTSKTGIIISNATYRSVLSVRRIF